MKNRGVEEILSSCMDGLRGLPDAIKTVYPEIVHQIRNYLKYIGSKDKKEFIKDLKLIYKSTTEELALLELDNLKKNRVLSIVQLLILGIIIGIIYPHSSNFHLRLEKSYILQMLWKDLIEKLESLLKQEPYFLRMNL